MRINKPLRIVSVVPSQTELLYTLGLDEEVVGITKFCVHPKSWFKSKTRVGGTKTLDIDKIKALEPTLVLANKEENVQAQIEALQTFCPVYVSDIQTIPEALEMVVRIGELCQKEEMARELVEQLAFQFDQLTGNALPQKVLYVIWNNPVMVAGKHTFIDAMLQHAHWENVIDIPRYPSLTEDDMKALNPEIVMLSSEPFPFKEKHIAWFQSIWPKARIELVDGELFSWYGSRMLHAVNYFKQLHEKVDLS